eukprot:TRINITY_DN12383_c0_g1_i3.p2 TRINITY_DN12383_c0_g1~~TRINITY_DN12383_c0_g1_i3.p2  ORF type:complete len:241 (+),score=68.69 TRINITY_DN12383_c0_g1_i3:700-1422(+)
MSCLSCLSCLSCTSKRPHARVSVCASGDGYLVQGQFEKGHLQGDGTMKLKDGRAYEGQFQAGKPHGTGKLTLPDGSVYEGEFVADNRHGKGTFKCNRPLTPFTYTGEWKKDKRHGAGVITFENGESFEGQFDQGRPLEGGNYKWPDGTTLPLIIGTKFQAYLGPDASPFGLELALKKIMNHKKASKESGARPSTPPPPSSSPPPAPASSSKAEDEDSEGGFGFEGEENDDWTEAPLGNGK